MSTPPTFDPLLGFADIELLVAKIYYRFSHLFLDRPALRDFWWGMAREEEQHASILHACRELISHYEEESLDPLLGRGKAALGIDEAFRMALEIETSEIDVIYGKLLQLGGPQIGKTMENLGVPA